MTWKSTNAVSRTWSARKRRPRRAPSTTSSCTLAWTHWCRPLIQLGCACTESWASYVWTRDPPFVRVLDRRCFRRSQLMVVYWRTGRGIWSYGRYIMNNFILICLKVPFSVNYCWIILYDFQFQVSILVSDLLKDVSSLKNSTENIATVSWSLTCTIFYRLLILSLIHIWRCRRSTLCRSRWSPYH